MKPSRILLTSMALAAAFGAGAPHPASAADDPKAREIMVKVNNRDDGDKMTARMTMLLIDRQGGERLRDIRVFNQDAGADTQRIMFFLSPPDVKDTSFLTYDYDDPAKSDDQWLYLPALRKTKRIANDDKSGSFMGSDFNYYDMTKRPLDRYDFTLLKEDEVRGQKVWVIQSTPRSPEVVKESGYAKSVVFVRQDNYVLARAVHWLEDGEKLRYLDATRVEEIDGVWIVTEMTMTTKLGQATLHKTVMRWEDVKFNQPLEADMFTVRRMEKGL